MCASLSEQMAELGALLNEGIRTGEVQPLPFKVYKADDVPSAFRYMASGAAQSLYHHQHSFCSSQNCRVRYIIIYPGAGRSICFCRCTTPLEGTAGILSHSNSKSNSSKDGSDD